MMSDPAITVIKLHLRVHAETSLYGYGGEPLHALLLGRLALVDEPLSRLVHDDPDLAAIHVQPEGLVNVRPREGRRVIKANGGFAVTVTCLQPALAQALVEALSIDDAASYFAGRRVSIEVLGRDKHSWETLAPLDSASSEFSLRIKTPVTFRRDGRQVILPDERLLIGSAMSLWKRFASIDAGCSLEQLLDVIRISRFRLSSELVPFSKYSIIGARGELTLTCDRSAGAEERAMLNRLLALMPLSGVGYKRAMGMGWVQLAATRSR